MSTLRTKPSPEVLTPLVERFARLPEPRRELALLWAMRTSKHRARRLSEILEPMTPQTATALYRRLLAEVD